MTLKTGHTIIKEKATMGKTMIIKKIILSILLVLCAVGLMACGKKEPVLTVSLLYEGAAQGLNPDGTRYDLYRILSDEVLSAASETTGVPADELRHALKIEYEGSEDTIETGFNVTYNKEDGSDAETVLTAVGTAYEKYMKDTYMHKSILFKDIDIENIDYLEAIDIIRAVTEARAKFLSSLSETGKYIDEAQQLKIFADKNLSSLEKQVIQNGMSRDAGSLLAVLKYRDMSLKKLQDRANAQYQNRLDAIRIYDATLFPTTSVPSVMGGTYYISTTKTGLDDIYVEAKNLLDEALGIGNEITQNDYIMGRLPENDAVEADVISMAKQLFEQASEDGLLAIDKENAVQGNYIKTEIEYD